MNYKHTETTFISRAIAVKKAAHGVMIAHNAPDKFLKKFEQEIAHAEKMRNMERSRKKNHV